MDAAASAVEVASVFVVVTFARHANPRGQRVEVCDLVSGEADHCRRTVLLNAREAARSGDRHDPRLLGEQPGQGDLAGGGADALREPGDVIDQRLIAGEVLVLEARNATADVVLREGRRGIHRPGEEALAERAERHETDAQLGEGRQDLRLRVSRPERVLALDGGHREDRVRSADGRCRRLGEPEVTHLPFRDQFPNGACDVLDGHGRVHAMLVEQVERVDAQSTQRRLCDATYLLGAAVEADALAVPDVPAELRGDDDATAERLERLPDQFLVLVRPVHFGRVEEGDAAVDCAAEDGDHLVPVPGVWPVALRHAHGAQTDCRDFQSLSESACVH
ncbi:hypothetical protein MICRO8M_70341 [Microbacterium sp. 8M]|nr:hypothetical protein MICRO8M_70341 [Microbacterium sp. 8M]